MDGPQEVMTGKVCTEILSQIRTKLRDWAVRQARARCYSRAALSSNDSMTLYVSFPEDSLLGDGDVPDGDASVHGGPLRRRPRHRLPDGSPTPTPPSLFLGFVLLKERDA